MEYGSEISPINRTEEGENSFFERINQVIREKMEHHITDEIMEKPEWCGHVVKMGEERLAKKALRCNPPQKEEREETKENVVLWSTRRHEGELWGIEGNGG